MKRFAITGPESTGKSTLSEQLALFYNTIWVREYAREYLEKRNGIYTEADLIIIAQGQKTLEMEAMNTSKDLIFCDTEMIVIKIWSLVKFGRCHPQILQWVEQQQYDHYFLCNIDIPWQDDPLREHPHLRNELFQMYLTELQTYGFPFTIISGNESQRLQQAIEIVNTFLV